LRGVSMNHLIMQIRFENENVGSAAFNLEHEDMVAYTEKGTLFIRTGTFRPHRQGVCGLVVAFQGKTVHYLHNQELQEEDVTLSSTVQQHIEAKQWAGAYQIACLGVTHEDWNVFGHAALLDLDLEIARKAFIRTQDLLLLNLVHRLNMMKEAASSIDVLKGEVLAYQVRGPSTWYDTHKSLLRKGQGNSLR
jgi:intraflagellar transport protein 122